MSIAKTNWRNLPASNYEANKGIEASVMPLNGNNLSWLNYDACLSSAESMQVMGTPAEREKYQDLMMKVFAIFQCTTTEGALPSRIDWRDIGNNEFTEDAVQNIFINLVSPLKQVANREKGLAQLNLLSAKYRNVSDSELKDIFINEMRGIKSSINGNSKKTNSTRSSSLLRVVLICLLAIHSVDAWQEWSVWNYVPYIDFTSTEALVNSLGKAVVNIAVPQVIQDPVKAGKLMYSGLTLFADSDKPNIADVLSYASAQIGHTCASASTTLAGATAVAAVGPGTQPAVPFLGVGALGAGVCRLGTGLSTLALNAANVALRTSGHFTGIKPLEGGWWYYIGHKTADSATKLFIAKAMERISTRVQEAVLETVETATGAPGSTTESTRGSLTTEVKGEGGPKALGRRNSNTVGTGTQKAPKTSSSGVRFKELAHSNSGTPIEIKQFNGHQSERWSSSETKYVPTGSTTLGHTSNPRAREVAAHVTHNPPTISQVMASGYEGEYYRQIHPKDSSLINKIRAEVLSAVKGAENPSSDLLLSEQPTSSVIAAVKGEKRGTRAHQTTTIVGANGQYYGLPPVHPMTKEVEENATTAATPYSLKGLLTGAAAIAGSSAGAGTGSTPMNLPPASSTLLAGRGRRTTNRKSRKQKKTRSAKRRLY